MEEESWRRIMEEESWMRNHRGRIWEASGATWTPRRHPGGTQETPTGTQRHPGGTQEVRGLRESSMLILAESYRHFCSQNLCAPGCLLGVSWMPPGCLLGASWVPPGCLLGAPLAPSSPLIFDVSQVPPLRSGTVSIF